MICLDCSKDFPSKPTGRPPTRCPACAKARHNEQIKAWKRDNRDRINKRSAAWRERNRERLREYNRDYIRLSRLKEKIKGALD